MMMTRDSVRKAWDSSIPMVNHLNSANLSSAPAPLLARVLNGSDIPVDMFRQRFAYCGREMVGTVVNIGTSCVIIAPSAAVLVKSSAAEICG